MENRSFGRRVERAIVGSDIHVSPARHSPAMYSGVHDRSVAWRQPWSAGTHGWLKPQLRIPTSPTLKRGAIGDDGPRMELPYITTPQNSLVSDSNRSFFMADTSDEILRTYIENVL